MASHSSHLSRLTDANRRELEKYLQAFEKAWDEQQLTAFLAQVPADHRLRYPALIEMIKIDMERRWQRGRKVILDAYLKSYPELGGADELPVDLIFTEYSLRKKYGAPAALGEYATRFPYQLPELKQRVTEAGLD
jgi:hypothetical protein